ncbi:MAG: DUF1275 domain-containing protein [Candidatus Firestonebacteria bacterium]|nr:DUF1275 domain-containing protein [Candidatus Firestonebacteria bacterium]
MLLEKENRTLRDDMKLGLIFGLLGGYLNAAAITILFYEIAPMSANWSGLAKEIGKSDNTGILTFISLIFCFILGAYIGVILTKKYDAGFVALVEACLLISISFISKQNIIVAIAAGGFATGMQNGMTSYLSHHSVRTTHLTSTITDIGISLARKDYKEALVLGSKTFLYICGAVAGVIIVKISGNMAFAFGGFYLIMFLAVKTIRSRYCMHNTLYK